MGEFTLVNKVTGESLTLEANSREEAVALANEARTRDPEAFARAMNPKLGLTPQDNTALLGGQGYKAEAQGQGSSDSILVGTGRFVDSGIRNVKQFVAGLTGNDQQTENLEKEEQAQRELFAQLDNEGVGGEDVGEALIPMLATMGGGNPQWGFKALMGYRAAQGAVLGNLQATVSGKERTANTALSVGVNTVAPMLGMTVSALTNAVNATGRAGVNWLGSMIAASKGNAQSAVFAASRAMSATQAARNAANAAVARATKDGVRAPGATTAALLADRAHEALGKILSNMRGPHAEEAAYQAALEAFEKGFTTKTGQIEFNPAAAFHELAAWTPRDLARFGDIGKHLSGWRFMAKTLTTLDEADPQAVRKAIQAFYTNPKEATQIAKLIAESTDQTVKRTLLNMLGEASGNAVYGGLNSAAQQGLPDDTFVPEQP